MLRYFIYRVKLDRNYPAREEKGYEKKTFKFHACSGYGRDKRILHGISFGSENNEWLPRDCGSATGNKFRDHRQRCDCENILNKRFETIYDQNRE